jgi:hypothetical protein
MFNRLRLNVVVITVHGSFHGRTPAATVGKVRSTRSVATFDFRIADDRNSSGCYFAFRFC